MALLRIGSKGADVTQLQTRLNAAGYRITIDGDFGPGTEDVVRRFQTQHHIAVDGIVGPDVMEYLTATPSDQLVELAEPLIHSSGFPHDDTASLLDFYGDPRSNLGAWKAENVVAMKCPWPLRYAGAPWPHDIPIHKKCQVAFSNAFTKIWDVAGHDPYSPVLKHLSDFSGSGNLRPVRGADSARISTHGFWAAIDFDAVYLPLGRNVPASEMPQSVVDAFTGASLFWGGNYRSRKDPMHVQAAHE